MGKAMRLAVLGTVVGAAALALSAGPAMAAGSSTPTAYTCTSGSVPSGNYASITVTGACDVELNAVINVVGNINVAPGAVFDAQSAPSTITVGHNVTAAAGSLLLLGCQPANAIGKFAGVPCAADPTDPTAHTVITVDGNVTATNANTVILRGLTVDGNVTLTGGGGDIPWSLKGLTIGGNLTVSGVTADWLGLQFSNVSGNVTLTNITATDPTDPNGTPTIQIVENTVGNNLNCTGLAPYVAGGLIQGEVNHVGHNATGQCAALI